MNIQPSQNGFTLIELMVTLAVVAIVLTVGVPSFQDTVRNSRLTTRTNELVTSLNLARSEAVKRGTQVTVCKSANSTATSPACTTSGNWDQGWVVFVDQNTPSGSNGVIDAGDTVLRVFPALSGTALTAGSSIANWIAYVPSGFSQGSGGLPNDSFTLCMSPKAKKVIINKTGRARVEEATC